MTQQATTTEPKDTQTKRPDWGLRGTAGVSFASALSFENVDVNIGSRNVLNQLNLELVPGEIVCLLGESGSGKSTILRAAAGIRRVKNGTIRINNTIASGPGLHLPPEKRGVGLMFQDFALFPHMTLLENAAFGLAPLGRRAARQQAHSALLRVGLADRQNDYPHMLSGGQQQRLALARSIAPRPGILMLDEPFSGLDARLRETVRGETLAVLRETQATSLIVTHDPEEAMVLGDRIALLREGKIVQIDKAGAVYDHPVDIAAARFMSPLTEWVGRVVDGRVTTPLGPVPTPGFAESDKVIVALRPVGAVELEISADKSVATDADFAGRIVSKTHALGVDLLEIQIAGLDRPLHMRRLGDTALIRGMDVNVSLNTNGVLVFAAD